MNTAQRLQGIGEYYFSTKLREIEAMNQSGRNVLNLGIGSPDLPPHPEVIRSLQQHAASPDAHSYQSYQGIPRLREAMASWYRDKYQVTLHPQHEILPLIGSKEGIMHISMTYLNPGDEVLIPNPGYPTYRSAAQLAGGVCRSYTLRTEQQWQPDFNALEKEDLSRVKLMWVNYPHMPTGALPTAGLFEKLVAFGKKHDILICHDNPYSFILNEQPQSILHLPGAMEVALELNSLSKSHNMAGWRIGMIAGAAERIRQIIQFKSNMDSGMFRPLQEAAITALSLGPEWYEELNNVYSQRKSLACHLLDQLGCTYENAQAGLFVWAAIPNHWENSYLFSDAILQQTAVFITPGGIFGTAGDRYLRISLCSNTNQLRSAIKRISTFSNHRL